MILDSLYEGHPHGEWVLDRSYAKDPEDGDGHPCRVETLRLPARFSRVVVEDARNSVNEFQRGWSLSTGSGNEMYELAHRIAKAVSEGMLDIDWAD